MAIADKNSAVHREQIDVAICRDDLDLLSFIVRPLLDFNLLHGSIWPSSDGIVVCVVRVEHVEVSTSSKAKSKNWQNQKLLHLSYFPFFVVLVWLTARIISKSLETVNSRLLLHEKARSNHVHPIDSTEGICCSPEIATVGEVFNCYYDADESHRNADGVLNFADC